MSPKIHAHQIRERQCPVLAFSSLHLFFSSLLILLASCASPRTKDLWPECPSINVRTFEITWSTNYVLMHCYQGQRAQSTPRMKQSLLSVREMIGVPYDVDDDMLTCPCRYRRSEYKDDAPSGNDESSTFYGLSPAGINIDPSSFTFFFLHSSTPLLL